MFLLKLCLFYLFSRSQAIYNVAFNNSILYTNIMSNTMTNRTVHFGLISGTPYDSIAEGTIRTWKFQKPDTKFISVDVDYARDVIYLYNLQTAAIYAIDNFTWKNDFSNISTSVFHTGISRDFVRLAFDWVNHNIYWTDPKYRWIVIQSGLVNGAYKVIVQEDIEKPYAIAVNPINRYLFWSDIGSLVKIERSSLSGTDRRTIIYNGLLQPLSIDVDLQTSSIVWVDAIKDTIETANFNGDNRRMIRRSSNSNFFDVAVFQDLICVTDYTKGYLMTINKRTGVEYGQRLTQTNGDFYRAVTMYSSETQPQKSDYCSINPCSHICVSGTFGAECLCREGFTLNPDKRTCYESSSYRSIIWCNSTTFCLKDIRLFTTPDHADDIACVFTANSGNSDAAGISYFDIDTVESKIIYSSGSSVYSVNIGTNTVASRILTATDTITGIALDWRDKNVYWTTRGGNISLVSQQTSVAYTLASSGLVNPRDLRILPLDGFLFWISGIFGASKIERCLLDGRERLTLVQQLTNPAAIAVDMNFVYWSDSGYIWKCNLDGTGRKMLSTQLFLISPGIIVLYKDYLSVTDGDKLKTFNANTASEFVIADAPGLVAVHILDPFLQPQEKGPCDVLNGDCEHICIPLGLIKVCKCLFGFTLDSNAKTCSSQLISDNFLFLTDYTHGKIYQLSLDTDVVGALDVDIGGNPSGVIYNYISQKVIWACLTTSVIRSVNVDGTGYTTLLNTGLNEAYADSFAIDFTSGNLYYTSVSTSLFGFSGVGVISPSGKHKKLIQIGLSPRAIVVDPSEGLMFWTDIKAVPPFIKKANMDGSNPVTIVSTNIYEPNGLAIDYEEKMLYLTDFGYNTIQKCTYNGSCTLLYTDPYAQLMDIKHQDGYLYYTAWNRPYVTKIKKNDTNDVSRLAYNAEHGRLDSISIYKSSSRQQPVSDACLPNGGLGPCSTFCFPSPTGFTCGCEDSVNLLADRYTCANEPTTITTSRKTTASTMTPSATSAQQTAGLEKPESQTSVGLMAGVVGGVSSFVLITVILVLVLRRLSICNRKPTDTQTGFGNPCFLRHPPSNCSDAYNSDSIKFIYDTQNVQFNKERSSYLIPILSEQPQINEYYKEQKTADTGYERLQTCHRAEEPGELSTNDCSKNVATNRRNNVLPQIPTKKNVNHVPFHDHQIEGFVSDSNA